MGLPTEALPATDHGEQDRLFLHHVRFQFLPERFERFTQRDERIAVRRAVCGRHLLLQAGQARQFRLQPGMVFGQDMIDQVRQAGGLPIGSRACGWRFTAATSSSISRLGAIPRPAQAAASEILPPQQ